jgi:hypothetical protein
VINYPIKDSSFTELWIKPVLPKIRMKNMKKEVLIQRAGMPYLWQSSVWVGMKGYQGGNDSDTEKLS